jgi:membrane protease YdiL (CAAX protease family)
LPLSGTPVRRSRLPHLLLFAGFAAWYYGSGALASRAANGLTPRFVEARGLVEACCHLFLLVIGFMTLQAIARQSSSLRELTAMPKRATSGREWLTGAALGWGIVVAGLLPLMLSLRLHAEVSVRPATLGTAALTLATLALATLANDMTFRGYPFRCLTEAFGSSFAVLLVVVLAGFGRWRDPYAPGAAVATTMLLTLLLSLTWLRTHAVWLAWGMHFAMAVATGVLFGLPLAGRTEFASVVQGTSHGPDWLTGGDFGPAAGLFSLVVLVVAIPVLYRVTRDFAWNYTHAPILPAGYEVTIAPPAAHTAMEEAAKAPALVQILPSTPQGMSGQTERPVAPAPVPDRIH